MAPAEKDEWFAQLDAELQRKTQAISKDREEITYQKTNINKALIQDFWNIVNRFGKINVQFNMEPSYGDFAKFEEGKFPDSWTFKQGFDLESVSNMQIVDMTQTQGRMGDSIKVWYYTADSTPRVRMVFVFCEGEHYYKYNGWKRIFGQFVVYDAPLADFDMVRMHEALGDVVIAWFESHLRNNREILVNHLKEKYEKGETFTE
jgi:hypothetical protein